MDKEKIYEVIVATPALMRYQKTVLSYLMEHYNPHRVFEIDQQLLSESRKLSTFPRKGKLEEYLSHFKEEFRYILFAPSKGLEIKIIYFIDEKSKKVYITDFFPTKMDPNKIMNG